MINRNLYRPQAMFRSYSDGIVYLRERTDKSKPREYFRLVQRSGWYVVEVYKLRAV